MVACRWHKQLNCLANGNIKHENFLSIKIDFIDCLAIFVEMYLQEVLGIFLASREAEISRVLIHVIVKELDRFGEFNPAALLT